MHAYKLLIEIDTFASFKTLGDDFNTLLSPLELPMVASCRLSDTWGLNEASLRVRVHHLRRLNLARLQVLVVLEGIEAGWVLVVRWAAVLLERGKLLAHANLVLDEVVEVEVGEDSIVRHAVIRGCRLEIMQVGETSAIGVAHPEWHVLVAVIDSVALFALKEAQHVVLDDGMLMDRARVRACRLSTDAVTDSKDIFELVVLKGVAVDIDHAIPVTDA